MRYLLLAIILCSFSVQAEVTHLQPDQDWLENDITLIDIRTQGEWQETGLVAGAIPITFFDEQGQYDARAFLASLQEHVSRDEPFAIICRTGNRTRAISAFLSDQGYQVVNLRGGIYGLMAEGYQPVDFQKQVAELEKAGLCTFDAKGC